MKKNYMYALSTVCIWSTSATLGKSLLLSIPKFQVMSVSSIFAVIFLLIMSVNDGSVRQIKNYKLKDYLRMIVLGFLGVFIYYSLYYYGLSQLTSQEACIINYLWPMMLVVFSILILREKLTLKKILAMAMSFSGVIVMTTGGSDIANGNRMFGILCCVAAAACYGLYSVLNKKWNMNPNITMFVMWLTTMVSSFVMGQLTEKWEPIQGVQWIGILWFGAVINGVGYLFWARALEGVRDSSVIANLAYLIPFLSIVVSAVFLQESIHVSSMLALVLIISGILLQGL